MIFEQKRWISLFSGIFIEVLAGIAYAWSVFTLPLNEKFNWSMSQLSIAYTLMSVTMMISAIIIVPKVRSKFEIRNCVFIGSLLYGGGILFSGFVSNIYFFYILFSIIAGIGTSLIYPVLISYSLELFPERTGFASGSLAAGLGLGSVIWAFVTNKLFIITGDISSVFVILGILYLVGICILSRFIYTVPKNFYEFIMNKYSVNNNDQENDIEENLYNKNRSDMVKDPIFYIMYIIIIAGATCGTMIITQGSPIMQFKFNMNPEKAALVVSVFSIANTIGRPVWGFISDKIGRIKSFIVLNFLMAVSMTILYTVNVQYVFIIGLMICTLCFGGIASLVAPITSDLFGSKYLTENYGLTFTVFGVSSMIGAPIIAFLKEYSGGYSGAFIFGLVLSLVGLVLSIILNIRSNKMKKARKEAI